MDFQHLSRFQLRQICYFMVVVQADNNFSQAANHLKIPQPSLSQRIQALEELLSDHKKRFEVKLFDRSERPIELTEAGKVFFEGSADSSITPQASDHSSAPCQSGSNWTFNCEHE